MLRPGLGVRQVLGNDRDRGGDRRHQLAERVQALRRRQRAVLVGVGDHARSRHHQAVEHFDEQAGDRQVRPVGGAADMEQDGEAVALALAGHQRRAVGQARPGLGAEVDVRLRQHLALDRDVLRNLQAGERRGIREDGEVRRLGPRQGAAERAVAGANAHRQQIVARLARQLLAGEAHHHAAALHPLAQGFAVALAEGRVVGDDDDRQLLLQQGLQAVGAHLVIGRERALDEIEVAQHRLARQRRVIGDEADRLAPAAVVQQRDAAGGGAVLQDDAAGAVGELDRQVDLDARRVVVRAEGALRQAEGASVAIEGAQADRLRHTDLRARDAGPQAVGVALRRQLHQRQVELQAHHVERAILPQGVAEGARRSPVSGWRARR